MTGPGPQAPTGAPNPADDQKKESTRVTVLITGTRLYGEGDPVDVLIDGEVIAEIAPAGTLGRDEPGREVLEAAGTVLLPGPVGIHTHPREPARDDTQTIDSGSAAAARGGYTGCSPWPTPTRSPTTRWSPTTCGTAARRSAWSTCTRSARSPRA